MVSKVEIQDIKALLPVVITYTEDGYSTTELFYLDHVSGDVRYARSTTYVPEHVKQAILEYVGVHTPAIKIPDLPEKPDYDPASFSKI